LEHGGWNRAAAELTDSAELLVRDDGSDRGALMCLDPDSFAVEHNLVLFIALMLRTDDHSGVGPYVPIVARCEGNLLFAGPES